ncbi:MAG: hypothetical protein LBS49_05455 [Candidatus Accumulibacter sp.]|nr:hypothetical protein [Accumulibacter sp.]
MLDQAVGLYPRMEKYLQQDFNECARFEESVAGLRELFETADA